jgi:hypothetical protein
MIPTWQGKDTIFWSNLSIFFAVNEKRSIFVGKNDMPAHDFYHQTVKIALEKDGWTITHDPYIVTFFDTVSNIDLGAEKVIAAEKESEKIAVEIKSFLSNSFTYEFHGALGQYLNYTLALRKNEPNRLLFLAIASAIYEQYFQRQSIQEVLKTFNIKLIIFNSENQTIEQWKP